MNGRTNQGSLFTVGLVSTPAPQHLSSTTETQPAFSGTFMTTPLQHLDYTLASISPGYRSPPPPQTHGSPAPDTNTSISVLSTSTSTVTTTYPRYTTASFITRFSAQRPSQSASLHPSSLPSVSSSSVAPPPSTIAAPSPFSSGIPPPPSATIFAKPTNGNSLITDFTTTASSHGPTATIYTTYNPSMNKYSTHTPSTSTFLAQNTPSNINFVSRAPTTTATYTSRSQVYTLTSPPEARPGQKVTLTRTTVASATRPGPTWPLRVSLNPSEGYDNLDLDLGEELNQPKPQSKTYMTREQFLSVPQPDLREQPDLELRETGAKMRGPWPSAQERLEERRRGGIWNLPPLPNASDAPSSTASSRNTLLTFSTVTTTSFPNAAPANAASNAPANGVSQTTTSFSRPGGYCNQAIEGEESESGGVWTVEGDNKNSLHSSSPSPSQDQPLPEPETSDSHFTLHDVPLRDDDSAGGGSDGEGGGGLGGGGGSGANQDFRTVYLNEPQPYKYCSNAICTAKYRYKLLFFLPMFLFEQFRRYANVFFLIIALLQQIPGVSPTGRYTTLVPLICILVVSAIKEIAEDIKRHRADDEINKREIEVLRDGQWQWIRWRHVQVGDIVKVHNNKFFPADLIILASSEPQALCYVETANLDGETNLKIRQGLQETAHLLEARDLMNLSGKIECEAPNRFLYQFTGNLKMTSRQAVPLSPDQVLLRGAKLQNTNWVFGLVVYTGHETKLMKNSATSAPLKRSTVDKQTNNLIILLFFLLIVLCLIMAVCNSQWDANLHWYLSIDDLSVFNFGINFITFIILFNNLIPISLQVTLEVVRFIQAGFINNDVNMVYEENDVWAMARTSNLNEELGMIKYVLSDKTGTLTCNIMEFKRCTIGGKIYSMDDGSAQELISLVETGGPGSAIVRQFLTMLAVCHTVIPDRDDGKPNGGIIYHAASPDERALVEGARELGFVFETRTPEHCIVDVLGTKEKYEILNVLEFTSQRKRMSVIVRTPEGHIKLYCKGADTVIYERLGDSQQFRDVTVRHLEDFAGEGLRTLCYAVADISPDFYEEWKNTFYKASTALQFRERKLEDAAQLIENNLTLLGATAIEDKLQDEVPETIAALLKAGIHVWVLTGDKQETAINIGHSCHLLTQGMPLIILNSDSLDETRESINRHVVEFGDQLKRENEAALIIDGKTLIYALTPDLRKDFLDLCISCKSVICCRVSPSQKAEVVELLTRETGSVTLAIGDGANDVAMIQKANVGVGIAGLEGLQAACASDYAIGQFRFLARLLFVHGAWNYSRLCKVILYSFYKNICLYVIELWWAAMSGWSGQVIFERWSIAMYNVLFTAAPPLVMGIFDRSCSAETRMKYPELYRESQSGSHFNWKVFVWWVWLALVHSVMVFVLPYLAMTQDVAWGHGLVGGYLMVGNMVYSYVVVTVCLKAGLETDAWTWVTHLAIWGSIASWFIFLLVYSNFWPVLPMAPDMCGIYFQVYSSPVFWFGLILIPLACLLPDVCVKTIRNSVYKSLTEQVRESEISNKDVSKVLDTKHRLTETARLLKNVFRRTTTRVNLEVELAHGFAFSQEEHGVMGQSEVIRAYDTTQPKPGGM
ncbi:probable phospholipid-transporting ATPase IA isoform X4 [Penaeus japonicus]|uniref:probable phospholipid-transporting ATPase IA isoform X4 n=1 Tax=Penaeus japonicus TaxID=27405 RepID=UPI001C716D29|nr:probable phospholipid-transporting ATPase IA isoform X4 [Penaeus japonicus]